ncbi:hypothetical protein V5O48_002132 [Marasmius crinis-equi]|uniref:Uncharacterized protein n=1 Tax=Marasmius crinis-equi TaxID=585013 RepID=A0ABR3FWI5_9AGAR
MSTTLLLESFPLPPSFIPPSPSRPSTVSNPPPSRPPRSPLPPIPGPSRLPEALLLRSTRSWRCNDMNRPDSIASVASARSNGASYTHSPNHVARSASSSSSHLDIFRAGSSGSVSLADRQNGIKEPRLEEQDDESIFDLSEAYGGTMPSDDEIERHQEHSTKPKASPITRSNPERDPSSSGSSLARFPQPTPLTPRSHTALAGRRRSSTDTRSISKVSRSINEPFSSKESCDSTGGAKELDIPCSPSYPFPPQLQSPPSLRKQGRNSSQIMDPRPPTHLPASQTLLSPMNPSISHTPPTPQSRAFGSAPLSDAPSSSRSRGPSSTQSEGQPSPDHVTFPTQIHSPDAAPPCYAPTDDPRLLHRELRSARSRSSSHKKRLNSSASSSPLPSPSLQQKKGEFVNASPSPIAESSSLPVSGKAPSKRGTSVLPPSSFRATSSKSLKDVDGRSGSPDIEALLDSTPRPRRRSCSSTSVPRRTSTSSFGSGRSKSASRSLKSKKNFASCSTPIGGRRASGSERESRLTKLERELEGFGSDNESVGNYGKGKDRGGFRLVESPVNDLHLMDDDGSASDSSLDIHTPLPRVNLLLRDGALSHKSKLLPPTSTSARSSVDSLVSSKAVEDASQRPGSTISLQSIDSKASLLKDTRDTPVRRLRHKNQNLLRGGLGLTTGLGWSDSEDEDAPSPLTKRLPSLIVSRKNSLASVGPDRPSLSRVRHLGISKSSGDLPSLLQESKKRSTKSTKGLLRTHSNTTSLEDNFESFNDKAHRITTYRRMPDMAISPEHISRSGDTIQARRGVGSSGSLTVSIPATAPPYSTTSSKSPAKGIPRMPSEPSVRSQGRSFAPEEILKTPSTSSSVSSPSIPPLTPKDDELTPTPFSAIKGDSNKILPPLPNPRTGSIRRPAAPGLIARFPSSDSTTSEPTRVPLSSSAPSSTGHLRQLQLPRYSAAASKSFPVPPPPSDTGSQPCTPTTPPGASLSSLPKPRTGTGMTYRSSMSSSKVAVLRAPATSMSRSPTRI